VIELGEDMTEE